MPTLKQVEKQISDLEGFRVAFRRPSPSSEEMRDVRSDLKRVPPYAYGKRTAGHYTVAKWTELRADPTFYETMKLVPVVLYYDGSHAPSQTRLDTVRASYPRPRR